MKMTHKQRHALTEFPFHSFSYLSGGKRKTEKKWGIFGDFYMDIYRETTFNEHFETHQHLGHGQSAVVTKCVQRFQKKKCIESERGVTGCSLFFLESRPQNEM